ncbi:integrin alpha [Chitinophaga pinensis]|uniref:integrin alpha n=1 Tax=Chitinophaga pinensis TaxID=79329 RepID=UPI0016494BB8|nr:integrin alpha [Chitinophaga pinensis]
MTERHARTVLERNQAGIQLGTATTTAGDINGDGFVDIVVGAPYYSNGQTAEDFFRISSGTKFLVRRTPA